MRVLRRLGYKPNRRHIEDLLTDLLNRTQQVTANAAAASSAQDNDDNTNTPSAITRTDELTFNGFVEVLDVEEKQRKKSGRSAMLEDRKELVKALEIIDLQGMSM
jgi:hypothetical protein